MSEIQKITQNDLATLVGNLNIMRIMSPKYVYLILMENVDFLVFMYLYAFV